MLYYIPYFDLQPITEVIVERSCLTGSRHLAVTPNSASYAFISPGKYCCI